VTGRPGGEAADRIGGEAAAWIVREDRGLDAGEAAALRAWLAADARHARAHAERRRLWKLSEDLAGAERAPAARGRMLRWVTPLGLAAALAVGAWFGLTPGSPGPAPEAELATELRRFLPDGSVVDLAPGAEVAVEMTPTGRRVRLQRGAAHFAVAKDSQRPFVVATPAGVEVRAVGTAFTVDATAAAVDVRVTEGTVEVRNRAVDSAGEMAPRVTRGHRLVVAASRPADEARIEPLAPTATRAPARPGSYEFDRTPLARAVAELNRSAGMNLSLADASLAELPIYAAFRADQTEAFIRLLEATGEVQVERTGEAVRLRRRR
jgi:transmembrane sensor